MKTIFFVVEGDTEEEFVKTVLSPYLIEQISDEQISIIAFRLSTNPILGKKGGLTKYKHLKDDLLKLTSKLDNRIVTTFIDY